MAESAAEQYARLKQERFDNFLEPTFSEAALKDVQLYETTCPSGMKFKYRPLDVTYAAAGGMMPMILSSQMAQAASGESVAVKEPTGGEIMANMQANAQMVRYCCIEPRIVVGSVNGHKNAISANDLTFEDVGHLIQIIAGGDGAERLKTFRRKRR